MITPINGDKDSNLCGGVRPVCSCHLCGCLLCRLWVEVRTNMSALNLSHNGAHPELTGAFVVVGSGAAVVTSGATVVWGSAVV